MPDEPHGNDRAAVRQIAWRELFPWLSIARALRLAMDPRQLVLAALGVLLTAGGWWVLASAFSGAAEPHTKHLVESYQVWPWQPPRAPEFVVESGIWPVVPPPPGQPAEPLVIEQARVVAVLPPPPPPPLHPAGLIGSGSAWKSGVPGVWFALSRPFLQMFDRGLNVTGFALVLLCALWTVAVWALFGGAITRLAAIRLAREERVPLGLALRHARTRWGGYFWAPLFPLIGALLPTLGLAAVGWLLRFDVGVIVLGVLFPLLLLGGVLIVILLLGLVFGWPLMWATVSVEGTDTFDALSRTYAYVYQRPLSYLFYAVVATLLSWLGAAVVWALGAAVVYLTLWGASWSAGGARMEQIVAEIAPQVSIVWPVAGPPPVELQQQGGPRFRGGAIGPVDGPDQSPTQSLSRTAHWGARLIAAWIAGVELLVIAFNVSFFWSSTTAIYFLLRKQVDATEPDEVYVEEEDERYGLPPLETDAAGVPQAADVEAEPDAEGEPQ